MDLIFGIGSTVGMVGGIALNRWCNRLIWSVGDNWLKRLVLWSSICWIIIILSRYLIYITGFSMFFAATAIWFVIVFAAGGLIDKGKPESDGYIDDFRFFRAFRDQKKKKCEEIGHCIAHQISRAVGQWPVEGAAEKEYFFDSYLESLYEGVQGEKKTLESADNKRYIRKIAATNTDGWPRGYLDLLFKEKRDNYLQLSEGQHDVSDVWLYEELICNLGIEQGKLDSIDSLDCARRLEIFLNQQSSYFDDLKNRLKEQRASVIEKGAKD